MTDKSKAQVALEAALELVDIVNLGTDGIPNREQLPSFAREGGEGAIAVMGAATKLSKAEYDEAMELLGIAVAAKVFENKCAFSDGSAVKITFEVVLPAPAEAGPAA